MQIAIKATTNFVRRHPFVREANRRIEVGAIVAIPAFINLISQFDIELLAEEATLILKEVAPLMALQSKNILKGCPLIPVVSVSQSYYLEPLVLLQIILRLHSHTQLVLGIVRCWQRQSDLAKAEEVFPLD